MKHLSCGSVLGLRTIRSGSPEKRFSFRAAYIRLYRQTVQQQERERKHENKIVRRRACCERGHDCSSEPRRCSRSGRGISQRRSSTQCPGGSRSYAAQRWFIVPLNADAVTRQHTVLFRPTPFLVWDAFVTCLRVSAAFLFESRFVHSFRSIHGSNYPATQPCRAIRESQKSSCPTCLEPAKHRNSVQEWKQSAEREQYSECKQSPERKQFPKWKQPIAP